MLLEISILKKLREFNFINMEAHIFHTSNKEVWDYVNQFAEFNRYTNSPLRIIMVRFTICHLI